MFFDFTFIHYLFSAVYNSAERLQEVIEHSSEDRDPHHGFEGNRYILLRSVDMFKCNLEAYKLSSMGDRTHRFLASTNCFWEVSEHVLNRIETPAALAGRSALCGYWSENPWVAKRKGVNLFIVEFLRHGSFFFERTLYTQVR